MLALGVNRLGFLHGPAPGSRAFHRACLFLRLWWVGLRVYFQTLSVAPQPLRMAGVRKGYIVS